MSLYSPAWASKPQLGSTFSCSLPTTSELSTPACSAIWRTGAWDRFAHDIHADLLVVVLCAEAVERLGRIEQRDAAVGDNALFDRSHLEVPAQFVDDERCQRLAL